MSTTDDSPELRSVAADASGAWHNPSEAGTPSSSTFLESTPVASPALVDTPVWVSLPAVLEPSREMVRPHHRRRSARIVRGRPADAPWVRPVLLVLLAATAALYLWDLGASGWANSFYSAAVQASTKSWKAFFFGSFDASNFITVDKPPASLWPMDLVARVVGVNAWSILVPEAATGVATVALVYATVRRWFTPAAGLIAGAVTALTPVAVLMFRFNNPDALLVLLLTAATYAVTRALEQASTRWLALAGAFVGFAFLTKELQAFLVLPALGFVYLVAAPTSFWRRIRQLCVAAASMIVAGGWWVAIVELWPAASRPYIGGSQNNSLLSVVFGYNGFGRVTGNETGSVTGGFARLGRFGIGGGGSLWGPTGWTRLFNSQFGGQDAWLLPAALGSLAVLLALTWRAPRTDRSRAAALLWGGSLIVSAAVFSFSQGIIHPYYTIALAPPIGALVGIAGSTLWAKRAAWWSRLTLASLVLGSGIWGAVLLDRTPDWHPWIRTTVVIAGVVAAVALGIGVSRRRLGMIVAVPTAIAAALLGPAAYSVATAAQPHTGAIPSAGPSVAGFAGGTGPGGAFPGGFARRFGALARRFGAGFPRTPGGFGSNAPFPGLGGRTPGGGGTGPSFPGRTPVGGVNGPNGFSPGTLFGRGFGNRFRGGGLLGSPTPSADLVRLLKRNASLYTWVAATAGANNAAGYQLATDDPVMALGGFNGSDPAPSLAQFQADVAAHRVHYFIGGAGLGFANGGSTNTAQIASWVESHFASTTVGTTVVYDLSG